MHDHLSIELLFIGPQPYKGTSTLFYQDYPCGILIEMVNISGEDNFF